MKTLVETPEVTIWMDEGDFLLKQRANYLIQRLSREAAELLSEYLERERRQKAG